MKKILFVCSIFLLYSPTTPMYLDYDAISKRITEESDRLISKIINITNPKKCVSPHKREYIVEQCHILTHYALSLSLTKSLHINKACFDVIEKIRHKIKEAHAAMLIAHDEPRAKIIERLESEIQTYQFDFSNNLHRMAMNGSVK